MHKSSLSIRIAEYDLQIFELPRERISRVAQLNQCPLRASLLVWLSQPSEVKFHHTVSRSLVLVSEEFDGPPVRMAILPDLYRLHARLERCCMCCRRFDAVHIYGRDQYFFCDRLQKVPAVLSACERVLWMTAGVRCELYDESNGRINFLELLDHLDVLKERTAVEAQCRYPQWILDLGTYWRSRHHYDTEAVFPVTLLHVSADLSARNVDLSQTLRALSMPKLARSIIIHTVAR